MTPQQRKTLLDFMAERAERTTAKRVRLKDWESRMSLHLQTRLLASPATATSYDKTERTAVAVLSRGNVVRRPYGLEALRISKDAVILTRLKSGGIPLLDSHNQSSALDHALGRIPSVWIEGGALLGKLKFNQTDKGREAEGMVARSELSGISVGYRVEEREIKDQNGRVIDPETDRVSHDDALTFTATRWELLEASLVTIPADPEALIRSSEFDLAVERAVISAAEAARVRMGMAARACAAGIDLHRAGIGANRAEAAAALSRMTSRQDRYDFAQAALARMAARERMHALAQDV